MTRRQSGSPRTADRWLAAAVVAAAAAEALVRAHDHGSPALLLGLVGAGTFAPVAWRRVRPLACVGTLTGLALVGSLLQRWAQVPVTDSAVGVLVLVVAAYSLGAYAARRALLLGAPLPAVLVVATDLLAGTGRSTGAAVVFAVLFVVAVPVCAGRLVRARRTAAGELRRRSAELLAAGDQGAREAAARARLAVSKQVGQELLVGMAALTVRVDAAARAREMERGLDGAEIAGIEQDARALLVRTRQAVVSLVPDPDPDIPALAVPLTATSTGQATSGRVTAGPAGPSPWRPAAGARSWTALAGSVVAGTLLLELPHLAVRVPLPLAVLACVAVTLPLALAWASPLLLTACFWAVVVLVGSLVADLDGSLTGVALAFVPPFVAAALVRRALGPLALATCLVGLQLTLGWPGLGDALVVVLLSFAAGAAMQEGSRLVHDLRRSADEMARQHEAAARTAGMDERGRLARELHDALGHSLTVVVLQAGALRRARAARGTPAPRPTGAPLPTTGPGPTAGPVTDHEAETLAAMSRAGHIGLAELTAGLGSGQDDDVPTPWTDPGRPGLAAVGELLEHARDCGLSVRAELCDADPLLDAAGRVALYRVVQESLTNVLRHAPAAEVRVSVLSGERTVDVRVSSTAGERHAGPSDPARRGLLGMEERVRACGGRLEWRAVPAGGFDVRAILPLTRAPA
ncbi:histidine kinase [Ornithinimicrobium avium]|uniref:histidine kinase n=1 Tax=Ornithinimicrobium avium TaxID=2283195 RepID=UPI0013B36336|nr:histidine kinase [Ornithinimicrobium avium]